MTHLYDCTYSVGHYLILVAVEDVFYKPKGQILIGASARGYKFGATVVRRACVTVAAESESSVTIEALDPVDLNDDLADALVATNTPTGKGSEFLGRLKSYSLSFKSAVAEKLSAPTVASESNHESGDIESPDSTEHHRANGNEGMASESSTGSSSLMSSMMTKALQAAASVASDYRGSSAASSSSLPSGVPLSAENLTSTLSHAANELRDVLAASSLVTSQLYQNVTKLVRVRLSGAICPLAKSFAIFHQCL